MTEDQRIHLVASGNDDEGWCPSHAVRLDGFCAINGGEDVACSTIELALNRTSLQTDGSAEIGDNVIIALPHVGLQKGNVSRLFGDGFEVELLQASHAKLKTYLDWLSGRYKGDWQELRRFERIVPLQRLVTLERAGEPPSMARIIDLSRSGVAFTSSKPLAAGEIVKIGCHAGRVVRVLDGGAAVHFDQIIGDDDIDVMVDLSVTGPTPRSGAALTAA